MPTVPVGPSARFIVEITIVDESLLPLALSLGYLLSYSSEKG